MSLENKRLGILEKNYFLRCKMSFLKIKNCIFKIIIELFVFNKTKRANLKARFAKYHLKKYVDFAVSNLAEVENKGENPNIIWQYWQRGINNAPKLIQKCIESTKKYHPENKIVLLDLDSIKDYVEIPGRYYDLLNRGKMGPAHFSDVLRTYLLAQFGGIWVDATIYFTGKIPDDIMQSDLFFFSKDPKIDRAENKISNFFIRSKANNKTILAIKSVLDKYWLDYDFAFNYFMYEHIATMLSDYDTLKPDWDKMPYYSALDTGILQKIMYDDFDSKNLEELKAKTNIHKLSYKILKDSSSGKSYYDRIIG